MRNNRIHSISIHGSREGATLFNLLGVRCAFISIHAPARGDQLVGQSIPAFHPISIHAPARGDPTFHRLDRLLLHFNPRSRGGSDNLWIHVAHLVVISIHAPRGRHYLAPFQFQFFEISIHAPARETTQMLSSLIAMDQFQSTLPRGERRETILAQSILDIQFQSTLPRGERPNDNPHINPEYQISIHAPARGATEVIEIDTMRYQFQSTLRRETTQCNDCLRLAETFQSTLREATVIFAHKSNWKVFQSTLPQGATSSA